MNEAGGADVDISRAADEPGGNASLGEILNVQKLDVKAPHEAEHDHLWCSTLSAPELFLRALRHNMSRCLK